MVAYFFTDHLGSVIFVNENENENEKDQQFVHENEN